MVILVSLWSELWSEEEACLASSPSLLSFSYFSFSYFSVPQFFQEGERKVLVAQCFDFQNSFPNVWH